MAIRIQEQDTVALIRGGKEGDANALNILFARYHERVLRIVRLRLNPRLRERLKLQSIDIMQEVFIHSFKKLPNFQHTGEGAFVHWLSRIILNVIRDQLDYASALRRSSERECSLDQTINVSKDKLRLRDIVAQEGASPTQYILKQDTKIAVDDLLLELNEADREVIIQHKLEGLTFGEIASYAGKGEDAVRNQFNRSFQKLVALAENNKILQELRF
ncbi:MAG: RNA polymerase sigma factor [Syntrophobacteraceae bacterium]